MPHHARRHGTATGNPGAKIAVRTQTRGTGRTAARLTLIQRAKATLHQVRFSPGWKCGRIELSPACSDAERKALELWIRRIPVSFARRLPPLKLAIAERLHSVPGGVFINEKPYLKKTLSREPTHAASYLPERYIVLSRGLFRQRVELGRILYHELCHFVWPRLGNTKRGQFQALLGQELRNRTRGELGYSADIRKASLAARQQSSGSALAKRRKKLEYSCESFCDTGSFVLLGSARRKRHSEYTLSRAALRRRVRCWSEAVLGAP